MTKNDTPGKHNIPSYELSHEGEKMLFAFRTMEEIFIRTKGKPDTPHRHNYYTVLWARKACGKHFIDYVEYPIKPNQIFFVSPGQVHNVNTDPDPQGIVLMFTREFLLKNYINEDFIINMGLFSDITNIPPLQIDNKGSKRLSEITKNISEAFRENSPFKNDLIGAHLKLFLIECNRYAIKPETENIQAIQSGKIILKEFKGLLENKFGAYHKVNDNASFLSVSPDYLNNVIKSSLGKTAKEFIQQRIVLEAKRLGIHTHLSSKEIAYQLGFESPSHFSKFFKNIEKKSFSEFRESLQKSLLS